MEVRPARGDEVPQLAAMLARAFHDDPVTAWFMRNDDRRPRYAARFFASVSLRKARTSSGVGGRPVSVRQARRRKT